MRTVPAGMLQVLRAFQDRSLDPNEYLQECRSRAALCEPWLQAFTYLSPPDRLHASGPLGGIPVGIKDIIDTVDMPTTYGSALYPDYVPSCDAWIVERIRQLGGCVFGKTVTTEFAWRQPGPTVNPFNAAHTPGGSSSGSAAAVAAGIVPLALGTQTQGSVIRPAAYCGVVGYKPSYGAIPRTGVHPLAHGLDHVGLFARAVDDIAYALSLFASRSDSDADGIVLPAMSVPLTGIAPLVAPRIALLRTHLWDQVAPAQQQALEQTATRLRAAGATVEDLVLPADLQAAWTDITPILQAEAAVIYGERVRTCPDKTSSWLRDLVAAGQSVPAETYIRARWAQPIRRRMLAEVMTSFDAVLTIPAFDDAPKGLALTGDASFCAPWTYLGVPALCLPAAWSPRNLPLGVQLVAPYRQDYRLLRIGKWVEQILDFVPAESFRPDRRQPA